VLRNANSADFRFGMVIPGFRLNVIWAAFALLGGVCWNGVANGVTVM